MIHKRDLNACTLEKKTPKLWEVQEDFTARCGAAAATTV